MKTLVLEFLVESPNMLPEEQFNKAFEMYRKTEHKNPSSERFYNSAGYTAINLQNLMYDLKQLHAISDSQVVAHQTQKEADKIPEIELIILTLDNYLKAKIDDVILFLNQNKIEMPLIPSFGKGALGNKARKEFVKANNLTATSNKNDDLDKAINDWFISNVLAIAESYLTALATQAALVAKEVEKEAMSLPIATTKEEVFTKAPDDVKEAVKLRNEFPFLNEPNCPDELYILVGRKFSHYSAYVAAHNSLLVLVDKENTTAVPMTPEEIFELATAAVVNFEADELIRKEMRHYQDTGKILGEHAIFEERKLKSKIDLMTNPQAVIRKTNLENYIRKNNNKLKDAKNEADIDKINTKTKSFTIELNLLNAKLGFSDK